MIFTKFNIKNPKTTFQKILFIFIPFSIGYFLSYLYRSTNAVLAPYLNQDLGINAEQLGLITSVYFLTFALFQLPLGILLDKYGARKVQTILFIIASIGAATFALGNDVLQLTIGRGLIGLGVSGALMGAFKAISVWFPKERLSLLIAIYLGIGAMGAVTASAPLELALNVTSWRVIYMFLSVTTILVSLLIYFVVPEKQVSNKNIKSGPITKVLKEIYSSYAFWRICPIASIVGGTSMSLQGLWAGPWLTDVGKFTQMETANILFIFTICMAIGIITMGIISDYVRKFKISPIGVMGVFIFLLIIPLIIITSGVMPKAIWPWVMFSLTSFCGTLGYAGLSAHFPLDYAGRVSTAVNLVTFLIAFISQYAIGSIMQYLEPGKTSGYSVESYQISFGSFLILIIFCYLIFILMSVLENKKTTDSTS